MIRTSVILVAAGKGLRVKTKISKPLIKIKRKTILRYALETFNCHPWIKEITIVVNRFNREEIRKEVQRFAFLKVKKIVLGGRRRQDSVFSGLQATDAHNELVLVHDACRPCISREIVSEVIKAAEKTGAAIVGVPVRGTIKRIRQNRPARFAVAETLDRDELWEIQTPQVFRRDLLFKAYRKFGHLAVTDDASLVEKLGAKVSLVFGSYNNIKITIPEDLLIAEAIVKAQNLKSS
jgi:2-C-methyl-D-erythritol 4-phosphate cytidylyltransferase